MLTLKKLNESEHSKPKLSRDSLSKTAHTAPVPVAPPYRSNFRANPHGHEHRLLSSCVTYLVHLPGPVLASWPQSRIPPPHSGNAPLEGTASTPYFKINLSSLSYLSHIKTLQESLIINIDVFMLLKQYLKK